MYGKSGQAVQVSSNNEVVLAEGVPGATTLLLGGCNTCISIIPEAERPSCVSLMDANRTDWYFRHTYSNVRVDPEYDPIHPSTFDLDVCFIMHSDTFYPNCYALEAVNYRQWYIGSDGDGRLVTAQITDNAISEETASFRIIDYNTSGKFRCFCRASACSACRPRYCYGVVVSPSVRLHVQCRYRI